VVNCQMLGDEKTAKEVSQLSGWQRLVKTKNGKAKPA
jgi:hypothetical protein